MNMKRASGVYKYVQVFLSETTDREEPLITEYKMHAYSTTKARGSKVLGNEPS